MLYYQDDKKYILQYSKTTLKTIRLGPYDEDMLPTIKNADGTDRQIRGIPRTSKEQVYYKYPNLRAEFIRFIEPKYQNLTLKDIKDGSELKVEWQCKTCNHKWISSIQHRAERKQTCGYCCKWHIQFPEKYIFLSLKQVDVNIQENYKLGVMDGMEFDMYDPILRLAIECSSGIYHSDKQDTDKQKFQYALGQKIRLIRIWQLSSVKQVDKINKDEYAIPESSSINGISDLNIIIDDICKQYELDQSLIDRKQAQDQAFLRTNKEPPAGESLLDKFPDLCRDWDYNKNGVIKPEMLYSRSNMRVHWKCFYCHREWEAYVSNRTSENTRCKAGCQACNREIGMGLMQEIPYIPDNKSNKN